MKTRVAICALLLHILSGAASMGADTATPVAGKSPTTSKATSIAPKTVESAKANDQLVLDPTLVTGNRELPKVMYIVPWKKADLGDLPGQPFNTLLDEALTPVDREVFQREVKYYQVIAEKDLPDAQPRNQQATPSTDKK